MEYSLRRGALEGAAVSLGGELISLRREGLEYIWGGDPAYWTGRNPILFPIVGTLKEGKVRFDGRTCQMARHGFARKRTFSLAERGEDFVVLALQESRETLEQYPYPFSLCVTHRLLDNGFLTRFEVENSGSTPMPFCIGAHTAFRCPLEQGERFEDYELVFDQAETADTLLLNSQGCLMDGARERFLTEARTLPLDYAPFARLDTLIFEGLRSTGVALRSRKTGRGVRMEFGGFPLIAFWTRGDLQAPYLCLEPWHGCAAYMGETGEFAQKPHCIMLPAGEKKRLEYQVTLLEAGL